jgi:polyhydroxybutyrate depolymerase
MYRCAAALLAAALALAAAPSVAAGEGCSGRSASPTGDYDARLEFDGVERDYRVHVPPGYDPTRETPVVLVFHGGLGTGRFIQKQSRMNPVSDEEGFLAVFPDGLRTTWNAGGCCEYAMRQNVDDVGFVAALLDRLAEDYCVDPSRVYATGFSNGAMLAHRLACELSDRIAAIAPVSGVIMVQDCAPPRPVPTLVFHGTADPRSLWEGGLGDKDPSKGVRDSIPTTMEKVHQRNTCTLESRETFLAKGAVTCRRSVDCGTAREVALCRIEGGGHQWPGGEPVWPRRLGPMNEDIAASRVMWDFFSRHALPEDATR